MRAVGLVPAVATAAPRGIQDAQAAENRATAVFPAESRLGSLRTVVGHETHPRAAARALNGPPARDVRETTVAEQDVDRETSRAQIVGATSAAMGATMRVGIGTTVRAMDEDQETLTPRVGIRETHGIRVRLVAGTTADAVVATIADQAKTAPSTVTTEAVAETTEAIETTEAVRATTEATGTSGVGVVTTVGAISVGPVQTAVSNARVQNRELRVHLCPKILI